MLPVNPNRLPIAAGLPVFYPWDWPPVLVVLAGSVAVVVLAVPAGVTPT
jgi:hypothetical protein